MGALFDFYKGFVVVVRKGCAFIIRLKVGFVVALVDCGGVF